MEIVGYKLVRVSDDTAIQSWGGTWGQCPGIPNPLVLPNGDHVCGAERDAVYGDWRLESWMMDAPPDPTIDQRKIQAKAAIDAEAEQKRLIYITSGSGQAMTYDAKQTEAREILFDSSSIAAADAMDSATLKSTYPMIWASIPSDGDTASAVATVIQGRALAWATIGAEIEKARLDAKAAVDAAVTSEQVAAARVVSWP